MCDLLLKCCKNIVYVTTFFFTFSQISEHPFFFFFPFSAMPLPQLTKQIFFFIFGNGIATIAKFFFFFYIFSNAIAIIAKTILLLLFFFLHFQQRHCHNCQNNFFFLTFSAMALPQLPKQFFFFYIFGNGISTIAKTIFFFSQFRQCHCHN